ncbi:hypothetical protein [Metallosphaera sp.]|uniref:hypothetical protein n=1 Tax=Metallosphaera sp. TaxID=2020860 RepID=UPI00317AE74E
MKYYINTNEAPEFSRIEKELTTDFGEYKKYRRLIMEAILTYLYDEVYIPSVSFRTLVIWVRRNYAETLKKLDLDELLKTNPEAYFCPICNFSVRSLNELLTHFLLTHKEYRSVCPVDNEPIHKPRYDIQHIPFFPFMYPDGIPDKISTIAIILAKYRFGTKAIKLQMERKNK